MPDFIARRWIGLVAIVGLFAFQSLYAVASCNVGIFSFWQLTAILVIPAVLLLALPYASGAVTAVVVLLPFVVFSNMIECAPANGGGAPMGYVVALVFGLPVSLLAGLGMALYAARRRRNEP